MFHILYFVCSAEGGDLHRHCIEADVMRTEKEICYLIQQICEAVRYLHDEKIVHLDLKVGVLFCLTQWALKSKNMTPFYFRFSNDNVKSRSLFLTL